MSPKLVILVVLSACVVKGKPVPCLTTANPATSPAKSSQGRTSNASQQCTPSAYSLFTASCHRYYNHSTGICKASIPASAWIYVDVKQQLKHEQIMRTIRAKKSFFGRLNMPNPAALQQNRCFKIIHDMYCHHYFPRCDVTSNITQPQAICREACEMLNFMCKTEWMRLMKTYTGVTWSAQDDIGEKMDEHDDKLNSYSTKNILMNCKGLPRMDGPDTPECFIAPELLYAKTTIEIMNGSSYDCFYGNGYAYRGNVSVTRSGYQCQSWSAQCPHRHFRTPDKYQELVGMGNECRNPGHQAPNGPWCYTTDPDVRWEYCNITRCKYDKSPDYVISLNQVHHPHQHKGNITGAQNKG